MKNDKLFRKSLLAASIAMITACSGGSDSTTANNDGTTSGVVTGFGSIYINGVEYETDSASIAMDGSSVIETELGVGDVCVLKGTVNADGTTGVATAVSCKDELEGYVLDVSGLNLDGIGTINVMGQEVIINADTVFNSNDALIITAANLSTSNIVEVSGFSNGMGAVVATRVETKDADTDIEVKGMVSALNAATFTFKLGSLTVDYSNASEVSANLVDGLYVEVKTELALNGNTTDGFTLFASKVEIEDDGDMDIDGDEGDEIKVQGAITLITDTSFNFSSSYGTTVVTFDSIEFDDDFNLSTLTSGMMITVEGYINANGVFIVKEIEEDHMSEFEAKGTVTEKTATTVTIDVANTPMTFTVNNTTRMIDEQDEGVTPLHYFSLSDVFSGDYVEIEYYEAGGVNIATELEREDMPSSR